MGSSYVMGGGTPTDTELRLPWTGQLCGQFWVDLFKLEYSKKVPVETLHIH